MPSAAAARSRKTAKAVPPPLSYVDLYRAAPVERIRIIKNGLPATDAKRVIADLGVNQAVLLQALKLSTATVNRKASRDEPLGQDESERVIGVAKLIGQLQAMVEESGEPEGFDAPAWLSEWLRQPVAALGGARPMELLDTMEGQGLVSQTLAQVQSGAYA